MGSNKSGAEAVVEHQSSTPSPHVEALTEQVRSVQATPEVTAPRRGPRMKILRAGDGDSRHGSTNGYTNYGCRCQGCVDAWSAYTRDLRRRRREARDA